MLTRQEQMEFILDHYENPRHTGPLADAEAVVEGGNPGCGDIVKVYLKINDGQLVATFEGEGCTISQASASYLMDEVNGKTLEEVLAIDHEALMESLGKEIVQQRTRCATLSLDTLRAAIRKRDRELMIKNSR
jgi:nitrogen fixation NifU-like protein